MASAQDITGFWLDEVDRADWYASDAALDARIRDRFLSTWKEAADGGLRSWWPDPQGLLAYIILTDQFSRNMFRNDPRAFSTDGRARSACRMLVGKDWDLQIEGPARQFAYLPLMHAESLTDQERAVRLFLTRMPEAKDNLLHARAHREVIRRFGRFPHRNAALGRASRPNETAFLKDGGYGMVLRELRALDEAHAA